MTGFDATLAARLDRLEAAIPAPPPPVVTPIRAGRRSRVRMIVLLAAAVALLGLAGAVGASRLLYPDVANPEVEKAIDEALGGTACISADQATAALRARFDAHGLPDWTIEIRPGVGVDPCLYASYVASLHTVILLPALGQAGVDAMHGASGELLAHCYGRGDAIAMISEASRSIGLTRFDVSADPWGPQGGPIDQFEAYRTHVAAGCFVYVGLGHKEDGTVVYYLWGPWP